MIWKDDPKSVYVSLPAIETYKRSPFEEGEEELMARTLRETNSKIVGSTVQYWCHICSC